MDDGWCHCRTLSLIRRSTLRPADMQIRVEELTVTGSKDFVTAAAAAAWLLVPARDEAADERPRLSLCVVGCGERGVPAVAADPGHCAWSPASGTGACRRLAGDGWDDYVKPFRTLEDLYVLAALASWLYGVGLECGWPQRLQLLLLGVLGGAAEVSRLPPAEAATHLLLASLNLQFEALARELDAALSSGPEAWMRLWQRDRGVLQLARSARSTRKARAAAVFGLTQDEGLRPA